MGNFAPGPGHVVTVYIALQGDNSVHRSLRAAVAETLTPSV
jgi:hypothetical protein